MIAMKTKADLIEDVARQLVSTEHDAAGAFVTLPLLYPSGSTVVVRINAGSSRYLVSDWGLGNRESEMYGAGLHYARHARTIAEKAGVGFDNQAFFIMEASEAQLAGAVVTIGNCSYEAVMRATDALAEKTFEDSKERLYERLVKVFAKYDSPRAKVVQKNAHVVGHSTTDWPIATLVKVPSKRAAIFEPVTKHHSSVAHAAMKFQDIALLGADAPTRIAVVPEKKELGTYLGVLSQSARVVDESASDETIRRLAEAA